MRDEQMKAEKLGLEFLNESRQQHMDNHMSEAIQLGQKAVELFKMAGSPENYARALNLVGVSYGAAGNDDMAIDTYLEGLEFSLEHNLAPASLLFYNNIGSRYQQLHEYEKAITYFRRAEQCLSDPKVLKSDRYSAWAMILYMNLSISCCGLGDYSLARRYVERARPYLEDEGNEVYQFTFLVAECSLAWYEGKEDYIRQMLDELIHEAITDKNATDYVQDMEDIASLLKRMKAFENWKKIILHFEEYTREQGSLYCQIALQEMWMDYYKTVGDMQEYTRLCVEYVELNQKQQNENDRVRAESIDMKIELREKEMARRKVEQMAHIDSLTGLGNRHKLEKDSMRLIQSSAKKKVCMGVGVLDLDFFKEKNDNFGHLKGDECLVCVANVIRESVADFGEAYRFGGDEFVVLIQEGDSRLLNRIANKIKTELFIIQDGNEDVKGMPEITLSQGYVSCYPSEEDSLSTMIAFADKALYDVKRAGKNNYHIFEDPNDRMWVRRQR